MTLSKGSYQLGARFTVPAGNIPASPMHINTRITAGWVDEAGMARALELLATAQPAPWYNDSLCYYYPTEWWFPERGESQRYGNTKKAVEICGECLVKDKCREYGINDPSLKGVWGGTTDHQREKIRTALRAQGLMPSKGMAIAASKAKIAATTTTKIPTRWDRARRRRREEGFCGPCANSAHKDCNQSNCACTRCEQEKAS